MKRIRIYLFIHIALTCCALQLGAQNSGADSVVPGVVKFAGILSDAASKPLGGTVGVTFLLYKEQAGGAPLWVETQNVRTDASGHYSVMLGSTTSHGIPADAFVAGEARWIGVEVSGQAEQARVQLVSVPYALKAADAQTLGGLPASAFLLAQPLAGTSSAATVASTPHSASATAVTTPGGALNAVAKFDGTSDIASSQIFDTGTGVGIGTSTPVGKLDVKGATTLRGAVTLPTTGNATAATGKTSQPLNLSASGFNSSIGQAVNETFRWQVEPLANNTANPLGKLSLLFGLGSNLPAETGLSVSNTGIINFAPGQTFPGTGNGTVRSVGLSAPATDFSVSGSPVTSTGTLNLQWLVPPTEQPTASAIVKRDIFGGFKVAQVRATEILVSGTIDANVGHASGAELLPAVEGIGAEAGNAGRTIGVFGESESDNGTGVWGQTESASASANAVFGSAHGGGAGVFGTNAGRLGLNTGGFGVLGQVQGISGQGVWGESFGSQISPNGSGPDGVDGISHSTLGAGVSAVNTSSGDGLFAQSNGGFAAFFLGDVDVDGRLSKAAGSFKIDHPLDPANKYLYHSFVESPDMMNVYNGNVVTDGQGRAVVEMPEWFEALNRDFRYQLTTIGQLAQATVASEIANHQFTILTDKPNVKVSWQLTGIRQDAYANAHRIPVEEAKSEKERGHYLHPELFGAPPEKSIARVHHTGALKLATEGNAKVAGAVKP